MADSTDVILQLSDKTWTSAQQVEGRLAALTNVLLMAFAVLQGFIVAAGYEAVALLPAIVIVMLGLYGGIASQRYAQRFQSEVQRFEALARRLDELTPDAGLVALEKGPVSDLARRQTLAKLVYVGLVMVGAANLVFIIF